MDLVAVRGDDETFDVAFKDPAGAILNLTGAQGIWFTAKRSSLDSDADALIQKSLGAGVTITNAIGGIARIDINGADTGLIETTTLVWDCQLKDSAGKYATAAKGVLTIQADVTRAL